MNFLESEAAIELAKTAPIGLLCLVVVFIMHLATSSMRKNAKETFDEALKVITQSHKDALEILKNEKNFKKNEEG